MKTAKKSWKAIVSGLFGVLIIASVCLSCKNAVAGGGSSDDGTGDDDVTLISYTAEQVGGESGVVTSKNIKLTFESEISDLEEDQITIEGSATKGSLSGDGTIWTIELSSVSGEGEVSVFIKNEAIEKSEKKVMVYKVSAAILPRLSSVARIDSTTLDVMFSKPVTDADSNCFIVKKTGGSETFTVSNATADDDVVRLVLVSAGGEQLSGLTITIAENAVKDLTGNGVEADAIGVSVFGEFFTFAVRTTGSNESFAIPTSSSLNMVSTAKSYDWTINWGDNNTEIKTGSSSSDSDGISHTYATAGDHQITITPNGSINAWLGAFGFASSGGSGANIQTNRDKVISVDSEITPLMTRTQAQIDGNTAPIYEWQYTFYYCQNPAFKMGNNFKFSTEWNAITTVGEFFAAYMFYYCNGAAFTMNAAFNMPQGITTVGDYFAENMFGYCNGNAFTMGAAFNMPQGITIAGDHFAYQMFYYCNGDAFTMGAAFNMPQSITTVGNSFARSMFNICSGANFTMNTGFNLPPGITTDPMSVNTNFCQSMFAGCGGAAFTMNNTFNMPQGITLAGGYFAQNMFAGCLGAAFKMGNAFNLPQDITMADAYFCQFMFADCAGASFTMNAGFNLPQGVTAVSSDFASSMFINCKGTGFVVNSTIKFPTIATQGANTFKNIFSLGSGAKVQTRTATSIINGAPAPSTDIDAFGPSAGNVWSDYSSIATNWKG
jgi:hypothetical protein